MAATTLPEVLDDLCSRFVINIPQEDLEDPIRVCFALEQAHWFYMDFYLEENDALPHLNMQAFITAMFKHWGPFNAMEKNISKILSDWRKYKKSVPVCGALILNPNCSKVVLVKSWGKHGIWGFPKGKINKQESNLTCAIREVREETGYDVTGLARADCCIQAVYGEQENTLFVVIGVPETTHFEPLVRKEISEIKFHKLSALSGKGLLKKEPKHIMIEPTISDLKKWLKTDLGQSMRKAAMKKADASGIFSSPALQGVMGPFSAVDLSHGAPTSNDGPAHDPNAGGSLLAALQGGNPAVMHQAESSGIVTMLGSGGGGGGQAASCKIPLLPVPIPAAVPGGFMPPGPLSPGLPPPAVRKPSLLEIPTVFQPNPVLTTSAKQPLLPVPGVGTVGVVGAVKPALLLAPDSRASSGNLMVDAQMAAARTAVLSPLQSLHSIAVPQVPQVAAYINPVTSPTSLTGLNDLLSFQFDVGAVMAPLKAAVGT